jgi:hypothetical protein
MLNRSKPRRTASSLTGPSATSAPRTTKQHPNKPDLPILPLRLRVALVETATIDAVRQAMGAG